MIPEDWQNEIAVLVGVVGLLLIPALLALLFRDKERLVSILSIVVASTLFFYTRMFLTQLFFGVFLVYAGVVIVYIFTSGYRHERKDGGRDRRYNDENNPFLAGLFSGVISRAIIAMVITFGYEGITGGFFSRLFGGIFGIFFGN